MSLLIYSPLRRWYAEDCSRLGRLLQPLILNDYLFETLVSDCVQRRIYGRNENDLKVISTTQMNMMGVLDYAPPDECLLSWASRCGSPYDPLDAVAVITHRIVACPSCFTGCLACEDPGQRKEYCR